MPDPLSLSVNLHFDKQAPDAALDPSAALGDVLGLLGRLRPDRIGYTHLVHDPHIDFGLELEFAEDAAESIHLVKAALIAAEGEAGYRAAFSPMNVQLEHTWLVATPGLDDPCFGETPIGLPLPICSVQDQIGRELRFAGAAYGYNLDCRRRRADAALARQVVPALARLERLTAKHQAIAAAIQDSLSLASADGWYCCEGICLRSDADDATAEAVESILIDATLDLYPFLPGELIRIDWLRFDERPTAGLADARSLQDRIQPLRRSSYALDAAREALVGVARHAWSGPAPPGAPRSTEPLPASAPVDGGRFAFLSYAHRDRDWVLRVMQALQSEGVRIWYDDGIEGGAKWDECLERRIRECDLLIACVSPAYEQSRYCRREIKFADLLQKPILPIAVEEYVWGEGLSMMFQELQVVLAGSRAQAPTLMNHISCVAPLCIAGNC